MIALLLRVICFTITTISNLITRAIFSFIAQFLVLLIQTCRVPGEATKGLLEQVGEVIKSIIAFLMELIMEIITSVISKAFELIKDGVLETLTSTSGSLTELVEKTHESLQGAVSDVPEALQGITEMLTTVVYDLWSNYMEAVGYVWENLA